MYLRQSSDSEYLPVANVLLYIFCNFNILFNSWTAATVSSANRMPIGNSYCLYDTVTYVQWKIPFSLGFQEEANPINTHGFPAKQLNDTKILTG